MARNLRAAGEIMTECRLATLHAELTGGGDECPDYPTAF
jgi:hypothetical protein